MLGSRRRAVGRRSSRSHLSIYWRREQKRFLANPDRYAPALAGNDSVLAFDRSKLIRGRREFGTFCENRIYLFSSKETLDVFLKDPRRYVEEVRQAENPPRAAVR